MRGVSEVDMKAEDDGNLGTGDNHVEISTSLGDDYVIHVRFRLTIHFLSVASTKKSNLSSVLNTSCGHSDDDRGSRAWR